MLGRSMSHHFKLLVVPLLLSGALVFAQSASDLQRMSDQLDRLDKQDFQELVNEADRCTRNRDFVCAESKLKQAGKLANGSADRAALSVSRNSIARERQTIERERQAEIARREAQEEEERREVMRRERQRQREEEEDRVASERSSSSSGANYGAAALGSLNSTLADYNRLKKMQDQTVNNVTNQIAERQRQEQAQRDSERVRQEQLRQERLQDQREAQARRNRAQQEQNRLAQAQADSVRAREAVQARADEQRRAERARAEQERQDALARAAETRAREERVEQARRERIAQQEAEKAAQAKAQSEYLAEVKRQFKLKATTCPDGEGKYYAVGVNPNIKPEVVQCYGIKFQAQCPGSRATSYGETSHFASMSTSCFAGESVVMEPKPACKPQDVRITVTEVTPCFK